LAYYTPSRYKSIHLICKDIGQVFKAIAGFSHIRDIKTYKLEVLINIMKYLEVMTSKMEVSKVKNDDLNA